MIRIGIVGYGNLGKSIVKSLNHFPDISLVAIFTRRNPASIQSTYPVEALFDIADYQDKIDVLILAGGSGKDIPEQAPSLIPSFHTVDVYDNHADIANHFTTMNQLALEHNKVAVISTGWDPGMFSLQRTLADAILPEGHTYTFWGPGLSQGHSDVVRRVDGVKYGVQYTLPQEDMLNQARDGKPLDYSSTKAHKRHVCVVLEEGANPQQVRETIQSIPNYFQPYDTIVDFISEEEFLEEHQGMPHGGSIIRVGKTSEELTTTIEYQLRLTSNPEFTGSISLAYARAAFRMAKEKNFGGKTVLDIPVSYLSARDQEELLAHFI